MNHIFSHPFTCIIAGPAQSGKSTLVKQILENYKELINPAPDKIIYCYSKYQDIFDEIKLTNIPISFHEGLPEIETLDKNILIIFDDLMEQCERDTAILNLFTVDSHHKNISSIFITHNFYSKGKNMRTLSLNSHYLILFNNPRDLSQIYYLARQMFPKKSDFLVECIEDAVVNKPYGYLFLDLKQNTPKDYRVRTGILPNDEEKIVYVMK